MRIAVVAGGWHFPMHFYREMALMAHNHRDVDLFVVAHRDPGLPIVREEKLDILRTATGPLADLGREMYSFRPDVVCPTVTWLRWLGWDYCQAPNTVGDWGFFNQWLDRHDYRNYDVILNCHDDTFIRRHDLFDSLFSESACDWSNWLICANGRYPEAPEGYVRGSFEFWKREMLDLLGGKIDLGPVQLTREGKTDSPTGLDSLSAWNNTCVPLRDFMVKKGLVGRISYLSPHYRISPWAIEGERGFMHLQGGAPWSFEEGLKAFPLDERMTSNVPEMAHSANLAK